MEPLEQDARNTFLKKIILFQENLLLLLRVVNMGIHVFFIELNVIKNIIGHAYGFNHTHYTSLCRMDLWFPVFSAQYCVFLLELVYTCMCL